MADEKELIKEAIKESNDNLLRNEQVLALLKASRSKALVYEVAPGVTIKYRAAIPLGVRQRLLGIKERYEKDRVETPEILNEVYQLIASLCLEKPWSDPEVWRLLDIESGETTTILFEMMRKIYEVTEQVKSFR